VISTLSGLVAERSSESIVVQTDGGVGYEVVLPLGVLERLPAEGVRVALYTELVVREDGWTLFGFDTASERGIFQRLLSASGFGPKLALALLSTLGPDRAVKSIQNRDIAALSSVSGIGRKKAERLILELQDRFQDLAVSEPRATSHPSGGGGDAVRALIVLGYSSSAAEDAVRAVLAKETLTETATIVRRALQRLAQHKGGP
jgi:holliday junction DNA helicase RuvA